MKKHLIIILVLFHIGLQSLAQFRISGKVAHLQKPDTITLNLPFVYGYYRENNIAIPVNKNGVFSISIPVNVQKFGMLSWQEKSTTILLTPGRQLILGLDTGSLFKTFGGTAGEENRILNHIKFSEASFITQGSRKTNPYANLSTAGVKEKVIKPWFALRDEHLQMLHTAKLSAHDKALIAAEIKYHAMVEFGYFARGIFNGDRQQVAELIIDVYANANPEPDVFPAGPQYYFYAADYLNYLDNKIFAKYPPTDARSGPAFIETYGISLDSANKIVQANGSPYIRWYLLKQHFSRKVAEQYLAQSVFTQWHNKDLGHAAPLMQEMKTYFPASKQLPLLQQKIDNLALVLKQNELNKEIKTFAGYKKVNSIYEVLNTLKGKVVYLDIWGTWCGPCKEELTYNPQLKQRFKGKDVAFVYLDMDEDNKDTEWQEFIKINGITGVHLRKNSKEIQQFWAELLADKTKHGLYPTYFIFDKNGKLVEANAKRPSNTDALYKDIEKYL